MMVMQLQEGLLRAVESLRLLETWLAQEKPELCLARVKRRGFFSQYEQGDTGLALSARREGCPSPAAAAAVVSEVGR